MRIISQSKTEIYDLKECGDIYIRKLECGFAIHFELVTHKTVIALYETEKQARFVFNKIAKMFCGDSLLELPSMENFIYSEKYVKKENGKIQMVNICGEILPLIEGGCFPLGNIALGDWWWRSISEHKNPYALINIDLSVRTYNCLKRAGINRIFDITSIEQLRNIRNLGTRCIEEVLEKMNELDIEFMEEQP